MSKFKDKIQLAFEGVLKDGMTIMAGGFGLCGIPRKCIEYIKQSGVKDLTIISNNCGVDDYGLGILLQSGQIKKMISSYVGENSIFASQYLNGDIEVELMPQGTLAERIRAKAAGIPAFYTPTGVGTEVANGKEIKNIDGRDYILEYALGADIAIVRAHKADLEGNLVFNKSAQNFNNVMAKAADYTIVEAEEVLGIGDINPDNIHVAGIYVDSIIQTDMEKRIEKIRVC